MKERKKKNRSTVSDPRNTFVDCVREAQIVMGLVKMWAEIRDGVGRA